MRAGAAGRGAAPQKRRNSINKDRQRYPRLPGRYQLHGYRLRTRSLTEIARDWCEEEGIA